MPPELRAGLDVIEDPRQCVAVLRPERVRRLGPVHRQRQDVTVLVRGATTRQVRWSPFDDSGSYTSSSHRSDTAQLRSIGEHLASRAKVNRDRGYPVRVSGDMVISNRFLPANFVARGARHGGPACGGGRGRASRASGTLRDASPAPAGGVGCSGSPPPYLRTRTPTG